MFYKVFCTCVSENTVKHTQRATFWSENVIKPTLCPNFRAEQCETNGFATFWSENIIDRYKCQR